MEEDEARCGDGDGGLCCAADGGRVVCRVFSCCFFVPLFVFSRLGEP
jgi:hypothetical protein